MVEAERIALARADQHAAEAQAVVDFLINQMLSAAYPGNTQGRPITVDEVLACAGRAIEGRFVDQPLVEASIRHQIAQAYFILGIGTPAVQHAQRARELRARHLGLEHVLTIDSTLLAAASLHTAGATERPASLPSRFTESDSATWGPTTSRRPTPCTGLPAPSTTTGATGGSPLHVRSGPRRLSPQTPSGRP